MATVGTVYMDVAYNTAKISKDLTAASTAAGTQASAALTRTFDQRLTALGDKTAQVGKKMSLGLSLPLVGLGALAVREFTGYEKSLTNIQGLVGATREQTQSYGEDIRRIGVEFGIGAQAAGEALYFITSSGFESAAAIEVLEQSAKAAASGLGEVPVIADLVTSAINAYGAANLSAAEATDILTVAVREGKGDPEQLAGAMSAVLPVASALGVQFDEVAGAMASMSLTGTSADEAATQLRGILNALNSPSKQAEEALIGVGLSSEYLRDQIKERGLLPVLKELTSALGDDSAATALVFEDVRALTGVMNILGQKTAQTEAIFKSTANSTGALNDAFEVTEQSAAFKLDQSLASLKDTLIELGVVVVPVVEKIANGVSGIATVFGKLPGPIQSTIVGFAGIVAVAGPLLFVGGKIASTFGKIIQLGQAAGVGSRGISKGVESIGRTAETSSAQVTGLNTTMGRFAKGATATTIAVAGLAVAWGLWNDERQKSAALSTAANDKILAGLTDNDLSGTKSSLAELQRQVAAIDEEIANSSELAFWDEDKRADLTRFRDDLVATGNAMSSQIAQAEALAAATGDDANEIGRWLAQQQQAGTVYKSNDDALKAYNVAMAEAAVVNGDAASEATQANTAFDDQRKAVQGLQSVFLGAIDGGNAYQDALAGIATAQRQAEQAGRGVQSAQRQLQDTQRGATDANERLRESYEDVADAQDAVTEAQRRLDEALTGTSVDDELSLEGARIRLAEAQQAMNPEDGFEDELDRRRAALALRQAEIDLQRLEEAVAGRPGEREAELADAQARLADAQDGQADAQRGVKDADLAVRDAAFAVTEAQNQQAQSTDAVADAEDNAVRAALDMTSKHADLAQVLRDDQGAAADLLTELEFLAGAYPQIAGGMQPYIDQLKALIALRGKSAELAGAPRDGGATGTGTGPAGPGGPPRSGGAPGTGTGGPGVAPQPPPGATYRPPGIYDGTFWPGGIVYNSFYNLDGMPADQALEMSDRMNANRLTLLAGG